MAKLGYSPLDTKEDGELTIDPNETKKEAKIRVAQAAYDEQRRRDPTLETSVRGPSMWFSYLSMSWLSPFMALGALKKLETTDIEALPAADPPSYTRDRARGSHTQTAHLTRHCLCTLHTQCPSHAPLHACTRPHCWPCEHDCVMCRQPCD